MYKSLGELMKEEKQIELDIKASTGYNIKMGGLELRYKNFCSYADDDSFRKRIFECDGQLGMNMFRHKGYQKFI